MTIEGSRLRIDVEERERWRRTMSVTVPADLVRGERDKIVRKLASRLRLPGFRKGHIPDAVVEKRYGPALQQETLDRVIGEAYREALKASRLQPISEGEVEDVKYEPQQDLVFSISFDVQPEIELGRLGGFAVERPSAQVDDDEVDRVLERLREQQATWTPVEEGPPETGDLVTVRIERLDGDEPSEGKSYELVLGEGDAIPDVESAIYTLGPGQSGEFDVRFPDDFPTESLRGGQQRQRISLEGRRIKELPELDDALARSVGEFETLDELRNRIREDLEKEAATEQEGVVRSRLLELLLEANPFEAPRSMVDRYVEALLGKTEGADPERVARAAEQIRPQAERAVKQSLLLDRTAETQELRATQEELDNRIQEIADKNGTTPAQVYARLQKAGRLEGLEREITERKVFDYLASKSQIVDAPR